jgi:hypothetical protein
LFGETPPPAVPCPAFSGFVRWTAVPVIEAWVGYDKKKSPEGFRVTGPTISAKEFFAAY